MSSQNSGTAAQNILSSLVVFVIAVPLSLGIALASGMPATSALVAAAIGGIVVGLLSGAPLVVSGPAAGLSALVMTYVQQFGVAAVYRITVMMGLAQLLFGIFKLGRFINKIPKPILEGVLSAIGVTILLGQLHILMGRTIPGGPIKNIAMIPHSLMATFQTDGTGSVAALLLGLLALGIQIGWPKLGPKFKKMPAALPACIAVTLLSLAFVVPRVEIQGILGHVGHEWSLAFSAETWMGWTAWLGAVVGLSVVASAETLLTARAIQVVADSRKISSSTKLEKELIAQGAGNFICGLLGGMPLTGVMVRSAANVDSGATTRLSTILHGAWVLLFVSLFPVVLEKIPLAVLASILVLTGFRLLNLKGIIQSLKQRHEYAIFWPLTAMVILCTDLLKGLAIALVLYLVCFMVKKPNKDSVASHS